MSLVLKRKNNSDSITAFDDAVMFYSMLGNGIAKGAYQSMEHSYNSSTKILTIKSGIYFFGGRMVVIEKGTQLDIDLSSFSGIRAYIMIEMIIASNDANSSVSIYASSTNTKTNTNPTEVGTHRIPLFSMRKELVSGWRFSAPLYIEPGVANNALNLSRNGTVGGKAFWDVFLPSDETDLDSSSVSGVRYAKEADVAAESQGFVGGAKNVVSENLYLAARGVYLLQRMIVYNREESFSLAPEEVIKASLPGKLSGGGRLVIQYVVTYPLQGGDVWPFGSANKSQCVGGTNKFQANLCDVRINDNLAQVLIKNNLSGTRTFSSGLRITAYLFGGK